MSKPPQGASRNNVTPMTKGGGSPRQMTASNSGASSSNFSFSSTRAGAASCGSPTTLRSVHSTPGKLNLFQQKIFPVIEYLT